MIKEDLLAILVIVVSIAAIIVGSCRYQRQVDKLIQDYRIELQNRR